ncbi:uncharacterized protein LOC113538489 [Pangasianodon hypophthalmus]|uniref:uncharacterized protein LOC113538489 n=1 Tax=Pangasianodon hypophthalmus TaxID=310915 RepID=UPI00147AD4C2|nr:uncharacterized protein LOC113538489 [Pangasianodon hypophthalmus]
MTTRVLQAFDTLDNHSKSVLDRLAKKNHQLTQMSTQCFAYGRPDTGLGLRGEFSARKKPKANKEIVSDEHDRLYKRLRKSLAVAASLKGSSRSKSVEAGSSRVIIHPEKHTTNVKSSTGHSMCGGTEEVGISFLIMPKKPQTPQSCSRSPRRMTWSKEVEKVPSLHELTKVNRSKALVGISLGDTDTCHWCSTSVHSEVDAFKSPVPDGSINTQQLQESTDNISTGTSVPHNKTEKEVCAEPVPLSFDDLLKRKDVKVLAPRLHKGFLAQQKASETYPVVYCTQQRQYEPFSSPGFHSLAPAPQIRKRNLRSAIILYTESVQAKYMIHSMRERQTGEDLRSHRPYTQPELKVKRTGGNCVNVRVLTADGKVIRSPDLTQLPLHYHDETSSVCASTSTNKISLIPKQNVLSPCVGTVTNEMNPNQTCDSGKISPACCKPLPASPRRGLSSSAHNSTSQSWWSSSKNKADFLSISRPLKCSQNGMDVIVREKQLHNGDWHKEAKEPYKNAMAEVTDYDRFSVQDMSFSRRSSANTMPSPQETVLIDVISTCSTTDSEKTHKRNASSCQPETINIPTADYLD